MKASYTSERKIRNSFQVSQRMKSQDKIKRVQPIIFMVADDQHMGMHLPYSLSNDGIKILIKENGGSWCHNFKIWKIPKYSYTLIRTQIPRIMPQVTIEDLPLFIDRALKGITQKLRISGTDQTIIYEPMDRLIKIQNNQLFQKLYNYQKQTLTLAVKNFGRLLIADEMGVGKTIQGLACSLLFKEDWPLLIICPSSLKSVWRDQIKKWMGDIIKKEQIFICEKSGQQIDHKIHKIAIYSYQIGMKSISKLQSFNIVIADQAHYLKNINAKRTQNLVPYLQSRKRVFLLSGTPALSKPRQLFTLIQIIRPDIFHSIKQFGDRYCFMTKNPWNFKLEYDGSRNSAQLHYILKNRIMIRRLKQEVLTQLPAKQRQFILIQTAKSQTKKIKDLMCSKDIPLDILRNSQKLIKSAQNNSNPQDSSSPLPQCYMLTGLAKIDSIKGYLTALLDNEVKVLIFAHHIQVLNQITQHIDKMKIQYIRIDGSTGMETRRKNVRAFQDNFNIRAAVLSITAAGVGITLTAATTVIFAQMHWNPTTLIQAEDRAHRVGQRFCVNVHYLIGQNTLDHLLLRQLQSKLETVGQILNGHRDILEGTDLEKGELGKWQPIVLSDRKRTPQKSLLDYISIKKADPKKQYSQNTNIQGDHQILKNKQSISSQDIDQQDMMDEDELEMMIQKKESEFFKKQQQIKKSKSKQAISKKDQNL